MNVSKQAARDATDLFQLCMVKGLLDKGRVRQVVEEMATARPRGYLATLASFRRLVGLECARRSARIESARPLSADQQAAVAQSLSRAYGPGLNTTFVDNPELLGGMRIQVGSDVYDGSVRGRLATLERSF